MKPRVLVLHAPGTNRDREAALACELAGGKPQIIHINQLLDGERHLCDYRMLVIPGGFSYGDDLGAGSLLASDLRHRLQDEVRAFIDEGYPVLGICNGFQALVKAGLLPGGSFDQAITLTNNASSRFECRWVTLQPRGGSQCLWIQDLQEPIYCPVAHAEGRLEVRDEGVRKRLWDEGLVSLTYVGPKGAPAPYPYNPSGSLDDIAGICNSTGNVLGLMPHPEDHIFPIQHPRWSQGEEGLLGLPLFRSGMRVAAEL